MEVRRIDGERDIRAIAQVGALAWREAYGELLADEILNRLRRDPPEDVLRKRQETLCNEHGVTLVAEGEDRTVRGYSHARWGTETKSFVGTSDAELKEIYVEPSYWREGVGTALLKRILGLLPASTDRIKLEMLAGNDAGHEFYTAHGFEHTGTSKWTVADETYPTVIYARTI